MDTLQIVVSGLALGAIYALIALGVVIILKASDLINFAHGELVMVGAIAVGLVAFALARRRTVTLLGAPLRLPTANVIDRRLVGGSLLFGVGWGLAGFCPGPALVALGMGELKAVVFVAAMLAGMGVFELLERRRG